MAFNAFEMKLATRTIPFHVDPFLKQFSLSAQWASLSRSSPQQLK